MVEIRSFRRVFDLERRIYRVDSIRLNPAGIPVRGVAYFLAAVVAAQALAVLPVAGRLVTVAPWYVRSLALPAAAAAVLGLIRVEGRHFHLAALGLVRFALAGRSSRVAGAGRAWSPSEIVFLPDGSDATLRALRYTGPGAAVIRRRHRHELRRRSRLSRRYELVIRRDPSASDPRMATAAPVAVSVAAGRTLTTRPERA